MLFATFCKWCGQRHIDGPSIEISSSEQNTIKRPHFEAMHYKKRCEELLAENELLRGRVEAAANETNVTAADADGGRRTTVTYIHRCIYIYIT